MFGLRGLRPDLEITGFETAFSEIAPSLVERGHRVTVYARTGAHSPACRLPRDDGVELLYMPSPGGQGISALSSTGLAVAHALTTQRFDVWFFVNVGMGHHAALARLSGRPVVMNVDGLDWLRGKWGALARAYFRSAARSAAKYCTELVTDAEAMRVYYEETFGRQSVMIAYGAYVETSERPALIDSFGIAAHDYFLIVSRFVPENSLDVMLEGFRRSRTRKALVVIGGAGPNDALHARLRTIAGDDPRIRFVGQVHDQQIVKELWCNCYAYLHGHSVGGTNPALLRAMGYGSCVLARDTVFNREVLGESGRFFVADAHSVATLVDEIDRDTGEAARLRALAPARIRERYTWSSIVDQYESLFLDVASR